LFENNTAGNDYLGILDLTGSPFLLAGSLLPVIEELGSLSPASPDFVQSSVGNTLFFAGSGVPQTLENIVDSSGTVSAVRVDIYRFHYYYLTQDNSGNIAGKGYRYNLILWKSVEYAGYNQINAAAIPDATKRSNTVTALHNNGILCAWDCSEDDVTAAFYSLTAGGSINADAAHTISQDSIDDIKMLTGISGSGFKYGVSFNTSTGFQTNKPVPQFAAASGHFPGGFEVLVVGSSGGRQVFVRLVLVSQGVGGIQVEEQIILCNVRDLW
ncbi:hypothetical protein KAU39_05015, partial [bacterium]|nr:hypothetical protein [bacterium]